MTDRPQIHADRVRDYDGGLGPLDTAGQQPPTAVLDDKSAGVTTVPDISAGLDNRGRERPAVPHFAGPIEGHPTPHAGWADCGPACSTSPTSSGASHDGAHPGVCDGHRGPGDKAEGAASGHRAPARGPNHVALIMDGNGRWAQQRGRPRLMGHHAGARRVKEIVRACPRHGVKYLTVFAFSTENWRRTQIEVAGLMKLFRRYIRQEAHELLASGVRVRFIGDRVRLDGKLVRLMDELELLTSGNDDVHLTVALNYGARDELGRATKRLAVEVAAGRVDPETVNETTLARFLDTCLLPDPDLVVRTSGEARISNFLLWQSAYAEYDFIDTLWPDFTPEVFAQVLAAYALRERRFGAVPA
jgi:undecaprenyl diphosphate synthase